MRRTLTTGLVGDVDPQEDEDVEEKLINEGITVSTPPAVTQLTPAIEYKTWKKNAPFLYDMILRFVRVICFKEIALLSFV